MSFMKDWKRGVGAVFHPDQNTKSGMSIGRSLALYYQFSVFPFIAFVVIASLVLHFGAATMSTVPFLSLFSNYMYSVVAVVLSAVLLFWVLVPIGIFINAAIYHLVGNYFLRVWKGDYSRTFMAVVLGDLPLILFYWLVPVPILGILVLAVFTIWNVVVLTIALSNSQKVSRLASIGVIFVSVAVMLLIVFMIMAFSSASLLSLYGPSILSGSGGAAGAAGAGTMIPYP